MKTSVWCRRIVIEVPICVLLQIMPDFYHFQHRKVLKRSLSSSSHVHTLLSEEPEASDQILFQLYSIYLSAFMHS